MTENDMLDAVCAGPPVKFGGVLSEAGANTVKVGEIMRAVVGELKVKGLGVGQILSVVVLIGYFIKEHGDDIEAIVKAVLSLFGK